MPDLAVVTTADRPDMAGERAAALMAVWPEFVLHDTVNDQLMDRVTAAWPRYDVTILDGGQVVAGGWAVPLRWDGTVPGLPDGYDGALVTGISGLEHDVAPDTLCVMAAAVRQDRQGAGLGSRVLAALQARATSGGLTRMIAPVRPVLKAKYPLTAMASYARWTRADGTHLDPWIRTHQRLGATILGPAPRSMVVTGTVAKWEDWTQMTFPETGQYIVPGALDPVDIDTGQDIGRYEETSLWMRHL